MIYKFNIYYRMIVYLLSLKYCIIGYIVATFENLNYACISTCLSRLVNVQFYSTWKKEQKKASSNIVYSNLRFYLETSSACGTICIKTFSTKTLIVSMKDKLGPRL